MMDHYATEHTIPTEGIERDAALRRVESALSDALGKEYAEIWIDHNPYPALCGLIHKERGWLMLLRYDGDAGYSSRGQDEAADSNEEISFILGNGQRDSYPSAWTLLTPDVLRALRVFATTGQVPETIH